jgi:hypothetical protein
MATQDGRRKISNVNAFFIIAVAVICDCLQFLLTLGVISSIFNVLITIIAWVIFGVWFFILGINYFKGKKALSKVVSVFGSLVIELIPILDALPTLTLGVIGIIVSSRKEEAEARKLAQGEAAKSAAAVRASAANDNEGAAAQYRRAA